MEYNASTARNMYKEARKLGEQQASKAADRGQSPYLPVLDNLIRDDGVLSEEKVGLMEIPLDRVIGTKTEGRKEAFSCGFMPLLDMYSEFGSKWTNLYCAQMEEGFRDPVKVYEYMNVFFVQEGNKRVSVAKFLDMATIAAQVTRVLPKKSEDPAVKQYYEFRDFFRVFPTYDIEIREPNGYRKFAAHFGQNLEDPWDSELQRRVLSAYYTFKKKFDEKGGDQLAVGAGGAYSFYLTMYGTKDSVTTLPDALLSERMAKLWQEYEFYVGEGDEKSLEESDEQESENYSVRTVGLFRKPLYSESRPLKVAFFYRQGTEKSKWSRDHELGKQYVSEHFGPMIETISYEGIDSDEKLMEAIDDAYEKKKNELFFTSSPLMMQETVRCAIHFPKAHFLNCSISGASNAVRTYYGKMYEAKFVLGALAASLSESHKIGYIASYPLQGVISDINAFALGASLMDPYAEIKLAWSSKPDSDLVKDLEGVEIISGSVNESPLEPSREYGLYRVHDMNPIQSLAIPVWNWGRYYEKIIRSYMAGAYEREKEGGMALRYYYGMASGVIDVVLSNRLNYRSGKMVEELKREIAVGQLHPFGGELRSQNGLIQKEGRLLEKEVVNMNWLCDNVIGEIPALDTLLPDGMKGMEMELSSQPVVAETPRASQPAE